MPAGIISAREPQTRTGADAKTATGLDSNVFAAGGRYPSTLDGHHRFSSRRAGSITIVSVGVSGRAPCPAHNGKSKARVGLRIVRRGHGLRAATGVM